MPTLGSRAVLLPDGSVRAGTIELEGERVGAFVPADSDTGLPETFVAPAFIDLQVNGHEDVDVAVAEGRDWERIDELLLAQGVTAWAPTLVSSPLDSYAPALTRIAAAAERPACGRPGGAPAILGAHLEGPFLGGLPGVHDPRCVVEPDPDWVSGLPPIVRVMTLAPEAPGALEVIAHLSGRDVLVSLGHSTAGYEEAVAAADAGARLVTHVFNALLPMHHREPGVIGAALADLRLTPSLIADLVHVHPAVVGVAFRARAALGVAAGGPGDPGIALVTDAVAWRAPHLAGTHLRRDDGDAPRRGDGTIAGSALRMDEAVRNAVATGVPAGHALAAASRVPARLVGAADRGVLRPGARADLVELDRDLQVRSTWVGGAKAWER